MTSITSSSSSPSPLTVTEPMAEAERLDMIRLIERRKAELNEKRQLLESLSRGVEGTGLKLAAPATGREAEAGTAAAPGPRVSVRPVREVTATIDPVALLKGVMDSISEAEAKAGKAGIIPVVEEQVQEKTAAAAATTTAGSRADLKSKYSHALKKVVGALSTASGAVNVTLTPKALDRFDKSCQCDPISDKLKHVPVPAAADAATGRRETTRLQVLPSGAVADTRRFSAAALKVSAAEMKKKHQQQIAAVADAAAFVKSIGKGHIAALPAPLSEEEKLRLISSSGFAAFFEKASRKMEKALGESEMFDVFADYTQVRGGGEAEAADKDQIRLLETYTDERITKLRSCTDVRNHPNFNELFLVSYSQASNSSIFQPDGCVAIWNISMPQRAEYFFTCQSQVCCALVDPYRPNVVVGGTFSGSVVLWDIRAKSRPSQRTSLSSKSHHHPVYSMEVVGTQHAHNLVTVDLDGRLCLWSLSMLAQPTESIDLKRGGKDVSCLSIGFQEGENNAFVGGSEDGSLFQAQIHGSKAGISESIPAHSAPVTAVDWHPLESRNGPAAAAAPAAAAFTPVAAAALSTTDDDGMDAAGFSDLLLSSSFDWTVKLWSPKTHNFPLHTFQSSSDYCMDVEWHPNHPVVFASVHADAKINIWKMSKDVEVPTVTEPVGTSALTKVKWSNDGCRLMTGNADGEMKIWGVSSELNQIRNEERTRALTTIEELKASLTNHRATDNL